MSATNIVLIGFMGSGKSTLSIELSKACGWFALDTDKVIEQSSGMSVKEHFARFGEQAWRKREGEFVKWASSHIQRAIIATGGGMPIYHNVKPMGVVVFLSIGFEAICARLSEADYASRPLFADHSAAKELFTQRQDSYKSQADIILDATKPNLAQSLLEQLAQEHNLKQLLAP